ncbi:MAG: hypothetical protein ACSHX9_11630 [Luteolibacter sp.]
MPNSNQPDAARITCFATMDYIYSSSGADQQFLTHFTAEPTT